MTTSSTTFGRNMKLIIDAAQRANVRALFTEALGGKHKSPREELDLFELGDGFSIGVFYVAPDKALTAEQYARAPWLEFLVAEPDAAAAALRARGVEVVTYAPDTTHAYFRVPGGPVFRLAPRAA